MKNSKGITLIALVVTIVVLLILAGVSISMLTGENGIITQAQQSKLQTEIGKEKEYITLSVSAIRGDKISRGDTSEITSSELQTEINKYTDEATVTGSGTLTVTYESGRSYDVEQDGSITQKEELTPEEAKKIVYASYCEEGIIVETADDTVYYVTQLQNTNFQKVEITDAEVITTKGIKDAGYNYFIDNEGKVYTCGSNGNGQLGNGTNENSNVPICISDIPRNALNGKNIIKFQSVNSTMIALDSEGKVYTWGNNWVGQLGNGTNENSNEPICISVLDENTLNGKNIIDIQCNYYTITALDSEGKVYTWGNNDYGQLGNGTKEDSNEPICINDLEGNVLNGKNIVKMQNDSSNMIALDSEGKVYTWGENYSGELGNGTIENSNVPICISDIPENTLNGKKIVEIQNAHNAIIALDNRGKVYTWGESQLGNGTNENSNVPICISDISGNAINGKNIIEIQNKDSLLRFVDNEGKVYTIGENDMLQYIWNDENVKMIRDVYSSMMLIDKEGKVYAWGNNEYGQFVGIPNDGSDEPICITDNEQSYVYNKKIKYIDISSPNSGSRLISFVTQEGELYIYTFAFPI